MGQCCTSRKAFIEEFESPDKGSKINQYQSSSKRDLKQSQYFSARNAFQKFNADDKKTDDKLETQQLYKAKQDKKIEVILKFLDNDQKLTTKPAINHPWAESPNTNGSLALIMLAQLLMRSDIDLATQEQIQQENVEIEKYTEVMKQKNLADSIKKNLQSNMQDRHELTILLSVFLLQDNEAAQNYYIQNNLMVELLPFLSENHPIINKPAKQDLRIATLQCIRDLYRHRQSLRDEFIKRNGLQLIASMFEINDDLQIFEILTSIDELASVELNSQRNITVLKALGSPKLNFIKILDKILLRAKQPLVITNSEEYQEEALENRQNMEKYAIFLRKQIQAAQNNH